MRRFTAIILSSLLAASALTAQEKPSLSVTGMYGWNETWQSHGGTDLKGEFPINPHFEACAAAEFITPGIFSVGATARPKFPLKTGELFLDGTLHFRNLAPYGIADFDIAASFGYRMDYVSVQAGIISHYTIDTERDNNGTSENVSEPINLLYKVYFNVRPSTSRWNAGAGVANYTDYEYERTWEPMYFIHAHYDFDSRLSLLFRTDLKPAGAFHLNAQFWGVAVRAGIKYTFGNGR